jgi:hypothetical protein
VVVADCLDDDVSTGEVAAVKSMLWAVFVVVVACPRFPQVARNKKLVEQRKRNKKGIKKMNASDASRISSPIVLVGASKV